MITQVEIEHPKRPHPDSWRKALTHLGVAIFEKQQARELETTTAIEAIVDELKRETEGEK